MNVKIYYIVKCGVVIAYYACKCEQGHSFEYLAGKDYEEKDMVLCPKCKKWILFDMIQ